MLFRRAAGLVTMLSASWAIGCGSPSPAPAEQAKKETQRVLELGRHLVVEDPGQAPRRQLTYAGAHPRKVQIGLTQREPDEAPSEVLPAFFVLQLDWRGQTPGEGPAIHEFAIEAVKYPPDPRKTEKPRSAEMEAATKTIDDMFSRVRGSVHIEDGQPLRIASTQTVLQLSPDPPVVLDLFLVPLPEVEVGVGARWVTTDAKTKERREYVLTKLDETSATIELERGAVDKLLSSLPRVRGHFELRSTAGSDGSTLLLADPLPTHGELEFEVVFEVPGEAGKKETVTLYQILTLATAP